MGVGRKTIFAHSLSHAQIQLVTRESFSSRHWYHLFCCGKLQLGSKGSYIRAAASTFLRKLAPPSVQQPPRSLSTRLCEASGATFFRGNRSNCRATMLILSWWILFETVPKVTYSEKSFGKLALDSVFSDRFWLLQLWVNMLYIKKLLSFAANFIMFSKCDDTVHHEIVCSVTASPSPSPAAAAATPSPSSTSIRAVMAVMSYIILLSRRPSL